jgi:formate-dependent nitrite reductase membrane component NrfD
VRGGLAVLLLVGAFEGAPTRFHTVEVAKLWTVVSCAALVLVYIWVMSEAGVAARRSVIEIVRGRAAAAFYVGVVALGIAVPLGGGALAYVRELSPATLAAVGICSLVGDFYVTYSIAKAGIYTPLLLGGAVPEP